MIVSVGLVTLVCLMAYTSLDHYLKHWEGCLYNYRVL
jgi:hypothetical protein